MKNENVGHSNLVSVEFMDAASTADVPDPDGPVHASREQSYFVKVDTHDSVQVALVTPILSDSQIQHT